MNAPRAARLAAALGLWTAIALAEDGRTELRFPPLLAEGIASLPRLVATDEAARRINERLAEIDHDEKDFAKDCNTDPPRSFVERSVETAYAGPRFVSFVIQDAFYCPGAAHPNDRSWPLTFDLATGRETDLRNLFPADLLPQEPLIGPATHSKFAPRLTDLYLALDPMLPDDCLGAIRANDGWFSVWLSDADQGLVVMPNSLSHADQACGDPVTIPLAKLRELGFGDLLTQSLASAEDGSSAASNSGRVGK